MNLKSLLKFAGIPVCFAILTGCHFQMQDPPDIQPNKVVPSDLQVAYQQMEFIGFIHFSLNTFTDKEWGYGDENPGIFNPVRLDVDQWVEAAKAAGMKELILTAKHHDGFCLWPSKYTEHCIRNSPYKNGQGDIVREFTEACRKHGLKAGLYLSPWDRNHKDYGNPEYLYYYKNQLRELLTEYGEINEIWFDGANGGDGYYGGANENRKIDARTYYDWGSIFSLVKELQPGIKIFSDAGPDVHWIGNEQGFAGPTFWSTISNDELVIGNSNTAYLNSGDPGGKNWIVGQCDVSIRPGWFYHESQDRLVKDPRELVDIYYNSVGRNAILLLNIPPDKSGRIPENDIKALKDFKEIIEETFANNLLKGSEISADNYRSGHEKFSPGNILDDDPGSYWATDDSILQAALDIRLKDEKIFDRILIQEPIKYGQRISEFEIDIKGANGWEKVFEGTTIGYKRLIRISPVKATEIKLKILRSINTIAISNFEIFKSSEKE